MTAQRIEAARATDRLREADREAGYDAAVAMLRAWAPGFYNADSREHLLAVARDLENNRSVALNILHPMTPSLDHISKLEGERDRLREALAKCLKMLLDYLDYSPNGPIIQIIDAALNGSPPSDNKGKNDG